MNQRITTLYFPESTYNDCSHYWYIRDNLDATNPTYKEVIDFLLWDKTDKMRWVEGEWMCLDFNIAVHNTAELNGLKCGFVKLHSVDVLGGHICLAWDTVDEGLIYTDSTGVFNPDFNIKTYDTLVFPKPMEQLKGCWIEDHSSASYDFIVDRVETIW